MSEIDPDEERETHVCRRCGAMFSCLFDLFCIIGAINVISTNFKVVEAFACFLA
jgi:hypothetical protein